MPFFFLGFIVGGYLGFSLLAFGGIGLIIALLYIQLNPLYQKPAAPVAQASQAKLDELED